MRSRLLLLLQAGASDTCLNKSCGDHVSFPVRAEVCGYRGQIKEVTCSLWNNGVKCAYCRSRNTIREYSITCKNTEVLSVK